MPLRRPRAAASLPALEHIAQRLEELIELVYAQIEAAGGHAPGPADRRPAAALSDRERDVLRLMQYHLTDGEIAAKLGISSRTVGNHAASIYRKLGVGSRQEAVDRYRHMTRAVESQQARANGALGLTRRQLDVLRAMDDRKSDRQIAVELGISVKTVRRHTVAIYRRLGVRSRGEAVDRYRGLPG